MWASMASWFTPTVLFCLLNLVIGIIFITSNLKTHNKQQQHKQDVDGYNPPQLARAPSLFERVRSINFSVYGSEQYHDPFHHESGQRDDEHNPPQLARAPSLLERVRSIGFSVYGSEQYPDPFHHESHREEELNPPQLARAPSLLERVRSINFSRKRSGNLDPSDHETHADPPLKESESHDHHLNRRSKSEKTGEAAHQARMMKSASEKLLAVEAKEVDRRRPATVRERSKAAASGEEEEVDAKADDFINRFKQQLKLQRLDSILRYREMLNRGAAR